jgi:hypothetical protein
MAANEQDTALSSYAGMPHIYAFGDLKIYKGKLDEDTLFYAWDAVNQCNAEACPMFNDCTFAKSGRCTVQANFLRSLSVMLYRNLYDSITELKLYRFGMSLMPLYKQLSKLYIEEHATRRVVYTDDKGVRRAEPIYKEIRDTLWAIDREWRRLGLDGSGSEGIPDDPFQNGNPYIHEQQERDGSNSGSNSGRTRRLSRRKGKHHREESDV